jgi:hypothetical protein
MQITVFDQVILCRLKILFDYWYNLGVWEEGPLERNRHQESFSEALREIEFHSTRLALVHVLSFLS